MKKLLQGIIDFRKNLSEETKALFAKLALGQKPDALFVACSDSRVLPNLLSSTNPGDLFVLRNIGNLIPPFSSNSSEASAQAALEFSVFSLNISDIIVCGHSGCGAMEALVQGIDTTLCPHLASWLQHGKASLNHPSLNPSLSKIDQVSQTNVLKQMEHIASYPFVKERLEKKTLQLHGWWFDIAQANVYCYEQTLNQFVLIDEKEALLILKRLG